MSGTTHIHAHGKLLLAGEYFVLDGATALAIPTRFGQSFEIKTAASDSFSIHWESFDFQQKKWFSGQFKGKDFQPSPSTHLDVSNRLRQIFQAAQHLGGIFPKGAIQVQSHLQFPSNWGLGSSSTLIYAIAEWLQVDAFELLKATFGGSGYDIACANSETAIFYTNQENPPNWRRVLFAPPFRENISFVYLGHKQNSREGIQTYRQKGHPANSLIQEISYLAKALSHQDTIEDFIKIIETLEQLTGAWIQLTPVKESRFADFDGAIKSLGAWGGDFVLAISPQGRNYIKTYFQSQKMNTVLSFSEMCLPTTF